MLSAEGVRRGHIDLDAEASFGMQPLNRSDQSFGGCGNRCARRRRRRGSRGSRVHQVIVDLSPHAIDLLIYLCGELLMSCRPYLLPFVRQHRQPRLQTMREVACLRDGARYAPFALRAVRAH